MATERQELSLRLNIQKAQQAGDERAELAARMALRDFMGQNDALQNDPLSLIPGAAGEPEAQEDPGLMKRAVGAGETALTMATGATGGALGFMAGTIKGIADELVSGEFGTEEAANRVEQEAMKMSQMLTFKPQTEEGQRQVMAVGEVLQQMTPLVGITPQLGAVAASTKQAARMAMTRPGTRLLSNGRPTPVLEKALDKKGLVYDNLSPEAKSVIPEFSGQPMKKTVQEATIQQIKSGSRDNSLAFLKESGGKIKPDKLGIEAVKQGFDDGFVQAVKTANEPTKKGMRKMLGMTERIKKNRRLALDFRPTDVVGDSMLKRVTFIRDKANKARTDLNRIARVELFGKKVDASGISKVLSDSLDNLDITLKTDNKGKVIPIFNNSIIKKNNPAKKAIKDMVDLLADVGEPEGHKLHKLKRQLDDLIDFKKSSAQGLSEKGRTVLKNVRHEVNQSLRSVSDRYAQTNDVLSQSLGALDDLQSVAGKNIDIFGESANKAIGQDLRGLMSNRKTRVRLEKAVNNIDDVARNLGGNFTDDVKDLAMFANSIEDRFGAIAQTSFKGEIESGTRQVATQGVKATLLQKGAERAGAKLEALRGINDFNAFQAMKNLLGR